MSNYIERYWRDATPADAIKEPPMVARFRDTLKDSWIISRLMGTYTKSARIWFDVKFNFSYNLCQVYDAPDPGEGWRLIDPEKDDYNQDGVEVYLKNCESWEPRQPFNKGTPFSPKKIYRIRINPIVTYVPFTWEDREQLRGRWIKFKDGREVQCTKLEPLNNSIGMAINCYTPLELLQSAIFLDTKKPVGKEVTQ